LLLINYANFYLPSVSAEEFQKLAFPASEFVLEGLLSLRDAEVWAPLPRIVEMVFNCGLNGWSTEMIANFTRLCWRYCILVEEAYGESECVITLHSLTHIPEDIMRFGSPDNYWCFQYERAVGRYVKQTSNKKGVEKTFARKESQREFIKVWSEQNKPKTKTGKFDQKKVLCISIIIIIIVIIIVKMLLFYWLDLNLHKL